MVVAFGALVSMANTQSEVSAECGLKLAARFQEIKNENPRRYTRESLRRRLCEGQNEYMFPYFLNVFCVFL